DGAQRSINRGFRKTPCPHTTAHPKELIVAFALTKDGSRIESVMGAGGRTEGLKPWRHGSHILLWRFMLHFPEIALATPVQTGWGNAIPPIPRNVERMAECSGAIRDMDTWMEEEELSPSAPCELFNGRW